MLLLLFFIIQWYKRGAAYGIPAEASGAIYICLALVTIDDLRLP